MLVVSASTLSSQTYQTPLAPQISPATTAQENVAIPELVTRFSPGGYQSISTLEDMTSSGQDKKQGKSRKAYIWGGAAIGALLTTIALVITIGSSDTGIVASPLGLLPVVVGGAVIGGMIGALASR